MSASNDRARPEDVSRDWEKVFLMKRRDEFGGCGQCFQSEQKTCYSDCATNARARVFSLDDDDD